MQFYTSVCTFALYSAILQTSGGFNSNFPDRKTWWAKRINGDVYTAGRLTERQIKYASEDGFKSIISLTYYPESGTHRGVDYPSSDESQTLATTLVDIPYSTVPPEGSIVEDLVEFADIYDDVKEALDNAEKPVLLSCTNSYYSTLVALIYTVPSREGRKQELFYKQADVLGYDYTSDTLRNYIKDQMSVDTAEELYENPPTPTATPINWYDFYWQMKPLYKNNFFSGQIQTDHMQSLSDLGIDVVINSRRSVTRMLSDDPSQEEVTLLNIANRLGTYSDALSCSSSPCSYRQTVEVLEQNRLDEDKANAYITSQSTVNYESRNLLEFGDDIGYNETLERLAVTEAGIDYVITPMDGDYLYELETWDVYRDSWLGHGLDELTPILYQCRTGRRSIATAMLAIAFKYSWSASVSRDRAILAGYDISPSMSDFHLWGRVLDGDDSYPSVLDVEGWWTRDEVTRRETRVDPDTATTAGNQAGTTPQTSDSMDLQMSALTVTLAVLLIVL